MNLVRRDFSTAFETGLTKQMVNAIACTTELWMHLGGLLSTQEAGVALGYRLRLLRFFCA